MDIQDLKIFARVATVQNLSAVGAELGLTPGTISKRLQALEDELSVRLFERTTRHIRITDEGTTFFTHVERILEQLDQARASVGDKVKSPKGRLKISAPVMLGRRFIAPAVTRFLADYPDIEVQVDLTDRLVGLQEEGFDVAIRTGILADSSLVAKRLAADHYVVVGAPAYLDRIGRPRVPEDLADHQCLVHCDQYTWPFQRDGTIDSVRVGGRLRASDSEFLHHAALAGEGLLRTMSFCVASDVAAGHLERVLAPYEVKSNSAVWAVYPATKFILPKLRVLLDFLTDWFDAEAHAVRASGVIG
jgi:DNA-binding transcriptional LysR family regulator